MIRNPSPLGTIEGQSNTYKWTPTTIVLHGEAVAAVLVLPTSLKMCLATIAAGYRMRLAGMIRAAHDDLRNHGHRRPQLPPLQITAFDNDDQPPDPGRACGNGVHQHG